MTTVACRDGVIAADSQETIGKVSTGVNCKKVFRLKNGCVIGFAGEVAQWESFLKQMNDALKDQVVNDLPEIKGCKGVTAILTDGVYIYVWSKGWEQPQKGGYFAIGNGMFYAIAAMKAGADAREAAKVGAEMDIYSGGRIQSLAVNG
jgi:ATP-dependent protease HslVU (ClpYQ) peptidase subunit